MSKTVWRFQDGRKLKEGKENENMFIVVVVVSIDVGLNVELPVPAYGLTL